MDITKLSLGSIHKNGDDEYLVEERMEGKGEIYIKLKKVEPTNPKIEEI